MYNSHIIHVTCFCIKTFLNHKVSMQHDLHSKYNICNMTAYVETTSDDVVSLWYQLIVLVCYFMFELIVVKPDVVVERIR